MALEQRTFQMNTVHEIEAPQSPKKQELQPNRRSKRLISKGEKFLFVLFSAILVIFSTMILHTQAQINDTNKEVQLLNSEVVETQKQNTELSNLVSEKSTYEVIWNKAKELGLNLNEKNVKVVPGR
ncbi:cell division protein FtsL [Sporosarcina thermotolerans]|uniref:Cell division protein FtsL n=1 Tax=Sporosarcina thermotolerans TaxID=633404 RepID=A0AAW9A4M2_9BACL|nr:cell division protein FtsL [Sporosarcina thermotolerans]MDW0115822.1 cell division protein FtsL [Sporosarcina thermotolerans]WHT46944.1 cell division protein FtsL [Sporosarcina thermotolerans]